MAIRILLQLFIIAIPFAFFGLYLLLSEATEGDEKRDWPWKALLLVGVALSLVVWVLLIVTDEKERGMCVEPPRYENGVIIPERRYPCEQNLNVGAPQREDPGITASGVDYPEELRDTGEIRARAPGLASADDVGEALPEPDPDTPGAESGSPE